MNLTVTDARAAYRARYESLREWVLLRAEAECNKLGLRVLRRALWALWVEAR